MSGFQLRIPVALIIFNRPDTTQQVFMQIRKAKPRQLLVIADAPRNERPDEVEKCAVTRAIVERVDWDCEVLKNYSDINLGCGKRVASGLDWVFNIVEEAIILEDDCLPHLTFFQFCQELLERYRDDGRVMSISGNNFGYGRRRTDHSYYFSRYTQMWGWATWRKIWQRYYDFNMKLWPEVRDNHWLFDIFASMQVEILGEKAECKVNGGESAVQYWYRIFEDTYNGKIDTWDYQFFFSCLVQSGLHILPNVNLVSNIGFGPESTHTRCKNHFADVPVMAMDFPLKHSSYVIRDAWADEYLQMLNFRS
ncbi:MAG: hypothetical protein H6Q68_2345 [Firmicutes bacterium]|nr:hypothetical protein [Bacillota bacterium]